MHAWSTTVKQEGLPDRRAAFFAVADRHQLSSYKLQRLIGNTPAQISHWHSGKENIPDIAFEMLACGVGASDAERARWHAARVADAAKAKMRNVLRDSRLATNRQTADFFAGMDTKFLAVHHTRPHSSLNDEYTHLRQLYLAAAGAVEMIARERRDGGFLNSANVHRHTCHPVGLVTAHIVDAWSSAGLDSALARAARDVRRQIDHWSGVTPRNVAENRIVEHAIYLNGRFGKVDADDRLRRVARFGDPFIERAAMLASALHGDGGDEMVVAAILRGAQPGKAIVDFERFHFGDEYLEDGGIYRSVSATAELAVRTLSLEHLGHVYPRRADIRKAQISMLLTGYDRPQELETKFVLAALADDLRVTGEPSPLDRGLGLILDKILN
jgi:hypothetical protein